jgi:hypothetical protein
MKIDDICAIVLKYEEPGWTEQTIACCEAAGITKIVIADRDGVGNMSKAFNRAVKSAGVFDSKYIWFLTNVTFTPDVPLALMAAFDPFTACVHPCHDSDHAHLKVCGHTPQEVPFVEFTAPMFPGASFVALRGCRRNHALLGHGLRLELPGKAGRVQPESIPCAGATRLPAPSEIETPDQHLPGAVAGLPSFAYRSGPCAKVRA